MNTFLDELLAPPRTGPCRCPNCRQKASELSAPIDPDRRPLIEEIIGPDTRRRIGQVSKTLYKPFRWICHLTAYFRHPQDNSRIITQHGGTGLLISPCHVLTVAHNLHIDVTIRLSGGGTTTRRVGVHRLDVTPGRDGRNRPFGTYQSQDIIPHPNWVSNRSDNFDYGLITLKDKPGDKRFKSIGNHKLGHWGLWNTFRGPIAKSKFDQRVVNVGGYPRDIGNDHQYLSFDRVIDTNPRTSRGNVAIPELFLHEVDTCVGQSGAPVWLYDKKTKRRDLVGLHKGTCEGLRGCSTVAGRSCFGSRSRFSSNMGIWYNTSMHNTVQQWMNQHPCAG